jgi:hypothetical protein
MTLSKAEACALLHISESTMTRRLKAGRYKAEKQGEGKFAPLVFTYADIGLTEPVAEVESASESDAHEPIVPSTVRPEPIPDIQEENAFNPNEYRDGFGHTVTGNDHHKMFASQPPGKKVATDDHMPEGLRTAVTGAENLVDSDAYRDLIRTPGTPTVAERMAVMGRSNRTLTDAEKRRFVDRAAFRAGLREGYAR